MFSSSSLDQEIIFVICLAGLFVLLFIIRRVLLGLPDETFSEVKRLVKGGEQGRAVQVIDDWIAGNSLKKGGYPGFCGALDHDRKVRRLKELRKGLVEEIEKMGSSDA